VSRSTPPGSQEFEISILGPGRGECVVIHLGSNEWCVVDSFVPHGQSESAAIEYLSSFENGALQNIRLIVATHWHDDHVRGLASILRRVPTAAFACSDALSSPNFRKLVAAAVTGIQGQPGTEEFASILGLIDSISSRKSTPLASPIWAVENRQLLCMRGDSRFPVRIIALSPSDVTKRLAMENFAQLLPKAGDSQTRLTVRNENHASVALWIEAGPLTALLGADLEHTENPRTGWKAVLACHEGSRADQLAAFLKVPHHGSKTADVSEMWTRMLEANPIAVVTSFTPSGLPRKADLRRLDKRTTMLYLTTLGTGKPPSRDPSVERMMKQVVKDRQVVSGKSGHVRVRWPIDGGAVAPTIEVFNGAEKYRSTQG
jgi:beta-lactamase superfamily II metal-dependent hydrolase